MEKRNYGYLMIKNYDELNELERNEAMASIFNLITHYNIANDLPENDNPDVIIEEAKKHVYVVNWRNEVLGFCQPYSTNTFINNDETKCLGFIPFKELGL